MKFIIHSTDFYSIFGKITFYRFKELMISSVKKCQHHGYLHRLLVLLFSFNTLQNITKIFLDSKISANLFLHICFRIIMGRKDTILEIERSDELC